MLSKVRGSRFAYARRYDFILTYKCGGLYEASRMWQVAGDGATGRPLVFARRITLVSLCISSRSRLSEDTFLNVIF